MGRGGSKRRRGRMEGNSAARALFPLQHIQRTHPDRHAARSGPRSAVFSNLLLFTRVTVCATAGSCSSARKASSNHKSAHRDWTSRNPAARSGPLAADRCPCA